jgi:hypothetical protein
MKLPGGDGSREQDRYALRRSTVLDVLTQHYVIVGRDREGEELYQLERDDDFYVVSLPELVPSAMIFRLASTFRIPSEEFYQAGRQDTH